jgi:hypothetical protein
MMQARSHRLFSYVPSLLTDELLYSFLGRLLIYNVFTNPREYLIDLFGTKDIIPSVDLPTALDTLQRRLDTQSPFFSADELIDTGTLYPYHRPFLTPVRHDRVKSILLNGGAKALKTLMGRVANRFGANPDLRYCHLCRKEDIETQGVAYWHRTHQLPGVTSCAIHGIDLMAHISPSESTDRQRFHLAPPPLQAGTRFIRSSESQVAFARISGELLAMNLPVLGIPKWECAYRLVASQNGFADANGRVYYDRLAKALRSDYRDFAGFQHQQRLLSTPENPLRWLHTIFERPTRSSHPILHLLLISFLFRTVRAFVNFINGLNEPGSREEMAAANESQTTSPDEGCVVELLKDRNLSSRAAADVLGLSVNTVVSRRRALGVPFVSRRKRVGECVLARVESALAAGVSVATISSQFGLSFATVYRIRRESPAVLAAHRRNTVQVLRYHHRRCLEKAIANADCSSVTAIRHQVPAIYAWLYRYDKKWLMTRLKRLCGGRKHREKRIDWPERDRDLCKKLKLVYQRLKDKQPRTRISRTALLRPLGETSVARNLARLPRLKEILDQLQESHEDFQRLRITLAVEQINAAGIPLSLSRVQRTAGIKEWTPRQQSYAVEAMSVALR